MTTVPVRRPQPNTINPWKENSMSKIKRRLDQQEGNGSALKTRQTNTIEHRVIKGPAILRNNTAMRLKRATFKTPYDLKYKIC